MTIEVIHRQANDKETIDRLLQLLTQAEALLGRCQRELPVSGKYDRLADNISVMRGRITNAIDDNATSEHHESFEQSLTNTFSKILDLCSHPDSEPKKTDNQTIAQV